MKGVEKPWRRPVSIESSDDERQSDSEDKGKESEDGINERGREQDPIVVNLEEEIEMQVEDGKVRGCWCRGLYI